MIFVKKIEKIIMFKIKKWYYLELLTPEKIKLLGITKIKITKDENGEKVPHLEITDLILIHWNIVNTDYQQDLRALFTFVIIWSIGNNLVN